MHFLTNIFIKGTSAVVDEAQIMETRIKLSLTHDGQNLSRRKFEILPYEKQCLEVITVFTYGSSLFNDSPSEYVFSLVGTGNIKKHLEKV